MRARWIILSLALCALVIGVSAVAYAHAYNTRLEEARFALFSTSDAARSAGDPELGESVARAAGCIACHTDTDNGGALLAGGVELDSPFGIFVSPNITSDRTSGIGSWTVDMLAQALLNGRRPDGAHYWPAFPYPAYAAMHRQDIADLFAWLQSTDPIQEPSPAHELRIPDFARSGLGIWKTLYVPVDYQPDRFIERGEYIVLNVMPGAISWVGCLIGNCPAIAVDPKAPAFQLSPQRLYVIGASMIWCFFWKSV